MQHSRVEFGTLLRKLFGDAGVLEGFGDFSKGLGESFGACLCCGSLSKECGLRLKARGCKSYFEILRNFTVVLSWDGARRAKPESAVLLTGWDGCDGSVLWEVVKMIVLIWIWETGRCCIRGRSPIRNHGREVATQTSGLNVVPLPLKKGVPNRGDILFALWKAGYQVDVDAPEYSEGGSE